MKIFFAMLVSFTVGKCLAQKADKVDEYIVDCLERNFRRYDFEVKRDLVDFENKLVAKKYLNDKTGKSYLLLYQNVVKLNDIDVVRDYYYSSLDSVPMEEFSSCYNKEMIIRSNSPLKKLFKNLSKEKYDFVTPSLAASLFLESMVSKDYRWESVRYYSLYTWYKISVRDNGLPEYISLEKDDYFILGFNESILNIELWPNDTLLLNNRLSTRKEIAKEIENFLGTQKQNTLKTIILNDNKKVSQKDYLIIIDLHYCPTKI